MNLLNNETMKRPGTQPEFTTAECRRAAEFFRALGDEERLRLVMLLGRGERSVGELAEMVGDALPTVSQRLKTLRYAGLVRSRRAGRNVVYALDDAHVEELIRNGLEHASHAHSEQPTSGETHDENP